ncbi:MAG: hypothetical protein O2854_04910 [Chloroflexi bacterium]|nr:hypothetical protein [Chloroflexota bacterium]
MITRLRVSYEANSATTSGTDLIGLNGSATVDVSILVCQSEKADNLEAILAILDSFRFE